jgi:hypothetical protein
VEQLHDSMSDAGEMPTLWILRKLSRRKLKVDVTKWSSTYSSVARTPGKKTPETSCAVRQNFQGEHEMVRDRQLLQ